MSPIFLISACLTFGVHYNPQARRRKRRRQERTKRELLWRRPLNGKHSAGWGLRSYRQVRGDRTGQCEFSGHADLSPDGHSVWRNTKGNLASRIPLRTHRWDESDRVFLAGCSPAEPASASSIHSAYQSFYVRSVSDPPAGPCVVGDCAREFQLPIHPTVCFEVGRFTLTQSSRTASRRCSRKWMSGHAAIALVLLRDRGQFGTLIICPLGEPIPPSQGESPFPVDFYLSWMSPHLSARGAGPFCPQDSYFFRSRFSVSAIAKLLNESLSLK